MVVFYCFIGVSQFVLLWEGKPGKMIIIYDSSAGWVIFGFFELNEISLFSGRFGGGNSVNSGTPVSGLFTYETNAVLYGTLVDITHRTTHTAYETA